MRDVWGWEMVMAIAPDVVIYSDIDYIDIYTHAHTHYWRLLLSFYLMIRLVMSIGS